MNVIKRSKAERMVIAGLLLSEIYQELLDGKTRDVAGLLQTAVYLQTDINRIVFWLNEYNRRAE